VTVHKLASLLPAIAAEASLAAVAASARKRQTSPEAGQQFRIAQLDSPGAAGAAAFLLLLLLLLLPPCTAAATSACCALPPFACLPLRRLPFLSDTSSTAAMPVAAATPAATAALLLMPFAAELHALLKPELTESNQDRLVPLLLLLLLLGAAVLVSTAASNSAEESSASSCCSLLLGCLQGARPLTYRKQQQMDAGSKKSSTSNINTYLQQQHTLEWGVVRERGEKCCCCCCCCCCQHCCCAQHAPIGCQSTSTCSRLLSKHLRCSLGDVRCFRSPACQGTLDSYAGERTRRLRHLLLCRHSVQVVWQPCLLASRSADST
jgi:hypothetical protein